MILLIDNYDSFTYNLYQIVATLDEVIVARNDKISLNKIKKLKPNKIILSPGPGRPEHAGICLDLIQQFADFTPILGVCLGHQAIAAAFGGKIILSPEMVHGKSSLIFHQQQNIYSNMPSPFSAGRYHSLIVDKNTLPSDLIITAESEDGIIMGLKHRKFPCFGMQFHPESILTPNGDQLIREFVRDSL